MWKYLGMATLVAVAWPSQAADWQSLFNGRNLDGWRANHDPQAFKVVDGVLRIQASSQTTAHLFYVGDRKQGFVPFRDFELEASVKAEPNSNGGIFVHTDFLTRDSRKHLASGYEVQLNSSSKEKRKTGSLYAIVDFHESPVDETDWFMIRVVVLGKRIRIFIDGSEVVDYTEPTDVTRPKKRSGRKFSASGGAIALQAHDADSIWYFRDIRVRQLP